MFSVKINILFFAFLNILSVIQPLIELVPDSNIANTEAAIRSTVNNLFGALMIKDIKHKPRLKHFSTIHNFFVSITLTDCDNLKAIASLSRVNDIDKSSEYFITQINDVLNQGDKSDEASNNDLYVTEYIDMFIKKIKHLKEIYTSNRKVDINAEILKYIDDDHNILTHANYIQDDNRSKRNDSDENVHSENEYWQPSGRRIYKGMRTHIKKFPFVASVQFFKKFHCAGSIIKSDLVITSASCLQLAWNNRFFRENPAFLSVQVGSDYYEGGGDNIGVLEIYFHPHYDPKSLRNNLAIMRLTRRIRFRKSLHRVKKIGFDKNPWPLPSNTDKITVIGWGAKRSDNIVYNPFINKLSYADLSYYPLSICKEHYSRDYVTDTNFCAGFFSKGGGACNRDAGGPGIVDDILMGVISFGSPICGATDVPTVFTKLGYYNDWITNIMEQEISYIYQPTTKKFTLNLPQLPRERSTTMRTFIPIVFTQKSATTETSETSSVTDIEALRIAQDQGFKDFLSTMFGHDEIKEYMDTHNSEIYEKGNHAKKAERYGSHGSKVRMTLMNDETSTLPQPSISPKPGLNIAEVSKQQHNFILTNITTDVNNIHDFDTSLEKDIMILIDNLDIKQITKPEISVHWNESSDLTKFDKIIRDVAIERSTESKESKEQISPKQQSVLNFVFLSKENTDKMNDDIDDVRGISIERDSTITFRDKYNKNNTQDKLTEATLYELISLAIDEEAKRINKTQPYIL